MAHSGGVAAGMPDRPVIAIVLAGQRRGGANPLAVRAGVSHKCLAPIAGIPLIAHVLATLTALPAVKEIRVSVEPEAEADLRFSDKLVTTAGYAFTDAVVRSFPADPTLEGKRVPQVPRHQATLQARYERRLRLGVQLRLTSAAWEDDRNELELDSAGQLDLFAGYAVTRSVLLFAAAENVTDAEIVVARTPVPSVAAPRQLRVGLRLTR